MLEAHIASPRGSFYYAGAFSPYDLETLRQHLRDSITEVPASEVRLELILDEARVEPQLITWLRAIEKTGVQVRFFFAQPPGNATHRVATV